jgi:2-oxo-hept-3-ene-1,7-dioate hydratase
MTAELDSAVRRQLRRRHAARAAGMPRAGWKICVNDPRVQARLGLAAPFVGWLNGARMLPSGATYPVPPGARFLCEPEIAIRVGRVDDATTLAGARAAIAALAPAFEVVDYGRLSPELGVIVETSSFHDGAVVGAARPPDATPALSTECPRLARNGEACGVADPTLVPADLALIVQLVARFLAPYGEELREGDWILSGACAAPIPARPGDDLTADFGPLGVVGVTMRQEGTV